jgi:hypothetical protein
MILTKLFHGSEFFLGLKQSLNWPKFAHMLWKQKVYCCIRKDTPLVLIPVRMNQSHVIKLYFFEIHLKGTLPSRSAVANLIHLEGQI